MQHAPGTCIVIDDRGLLTTAVKKSQLIKGGTPLLLVAILHGRTIALSGSAAVELDGSTLGTGADLVLERGNVAHGRDGDDERTSS